MIEDTLKSIKELKDLQDAGTISQEEFQSLKNEILNSKIEKEDRLSNAIRNEIHREGFISNLLATSFRGIKRFLLWIILIGAILYLFVDITPSASSIEEGKEIIVGTWIATPIGSVWKKIEFKSNGTYQLWSALPNSGHWGSLEYSGRYEILEAKYSDTGKKYIYAKLDESGICNYKMIISGNASLVCGSETHTYINIEKTDENPW